jgi:hypothetical protein
MDTIEQPEGHEPQSSEAATRASLATRLLNKSAVRDFTFAALAKRNPDLVRKFTRISSGFYVEMEARLRNAIVSHVQNMPTSGKTIR